MPLVINDQHVLPDGIHDASLDEVRELFGSFQRTDRRCTLFARLAEYVEALRQAGLKCQLIIDGSFIMRCIDEPQDMDIVLILPKNWDMSADLQPNQYNLISKKDVKRSFPFDVYAVQEGSGAEAEWIAFFAKVNVKWYEVHGFPDDSTKGLVRLVI